MLLEISRALLSIFVFANFWLLVDHFLARSFAIVAACKVIVVDRCLKTGRTLGDGTLISAEDRPPGGQQAELKDAI